jgi:DNA-binding transcriptional regulator YiaG
MPTAARRTIGKQIRRVRLNLDLTQGKFAELFNKTEPLELQTTLQSVCNYETAVSPCKAEMYVKFLSLDRS